MKINTILKAACSGLVSSTLAVSISHAQTNGTPADSFQLEEIVVTAQKSTQSAQDIGLVVNSFGGDSLREQGVDEISDLVGLLPNVQLLDATGGGVPIVFIRGVGLADFRVNNTPAAAFYVDEVYKPSVAMVGSTYFDLERIEVLKGPQGGLYGRNTTAGAVQIITQKPSLDKVGGYATAGYGRYGRMELEGAVNFPVSDTTAFRISARQVDSDDTYTNSVQNNAQPGQSIVSGGDRHGEENQWALRTQMLYQPSDSFDLLVKGYAGENKSETNLLRPVGIWAPGDADNDQYADSAFSNTVCDSLLAGVRDPRNCVTISGQTPVELGITDDVYKTASSNYNQVNNRWSGATIIANKELSTSLKLTSITGYEDFDHARPTDWDGIDLAYQDFDYHTDISAFSQEFRLAFTGDTVDAIGGINYAKEELQENTVLFASVGLVPLAFGHNEVIQNYKQEVDSIAAFGRIDWHLSAALNLVFEGRYTSEEKSFSGATSLRSQVGSTDKVTETLFVDPSQPDVSFDDFSGKVALEYAVNDETLTYILLSRGFKSGGFPGGVVLSSADASSYDPETITAIETGLKSDLMDGRLRANLSAFFYDYKDLQGSALVPASGGVTIDRFQNIGDAEVYGFDAEISYTPIRNLFLQALIGYSEGEISNSEAIQLSPLTGATYRLEGKELNYKPDWNVNLLARYSFDINADIKAYLQTGYDWRSSQNFTYIGIPAEEALFSEDSYGLLSLQLGFGPVDDNWSVSAYVKNAANEEFRSNARTDSLGGVYEIYGAPRIWGVTGSIKF
jgi:iron complex outermembrane receptor protein